MRKVGRPGPVWIGVIVVAVFFAGVTLAVALVGGGPDIPHAAGGDAAACTSCHGESRLPESHDGRSDDGCPSCHSEGQEDDGAGVDGAGLVRMATGVSM
jgi:hypothetical protein